MYIAIAGNIGSGKTSLTTILAERCKTKIYYEDCDNPYLGDFYEDMNRWSFNLQIYFLGSRIAQAAEIIKSGEDLIQDRTIFEDAHIFAANLHEMGLMSTRDITSYMKVFEICSDMIPKPDLLIYLKASVPTLVSQIQKRGRAYEMSIDESYLLKLNEKYDYWVKNIYKGTVLTIDIDKNDFIMEPELLDPIVAQIMELKATHQG